MASKTPSPRILLTGCAGFIGYHLAERLLADGATVHGIDSLNQFYDPRLKEARLARLMERERFTWTKCDLADRRRLDRVFAAAAPEVVVNLAAQAGVRYSVSNPEVYVQSNLVGFVNLLECCRVAKPRHVVFASSSSVYGANTRAPSSEHASTDHPLNLYAASKKSGELIAHAYAHLFGIPMTGLRFFTVYGPWGRPDMATFLFSEAILEGRPIELFGDGKLLRDFTYVDDVVEGVVRLIDRVPVRTPSWRGEEPDPATSAAPWRIFNIGHGEPVTVLRLVELLEQSLGIKAITVLKPRDPADVPKTCADSADLEKVTGFRPQMALEDGIPRFVEWFRRWRDGEFSTRRSQRFTRR